MGNKAQTANQDAKAQQRGIASPDISMKDEEGFVLLSTEEAPAPTASESQQQQETVNTSSSRQLARTASSRNVYAFSRSEHNQRAVAKQKQDSLVQYKHQIRREQKKVKRSTTAAAAQLHFSKKRRSAHSVSQCRARPHQRTGAGHRGVQRNNNNSVRL